MRRAPSCAAARARDGGRLPAARARSSRRAGTRSVVAHPMFLAAPRGRRLAAKVHQVRREGGAVSIGVKWVQAVPEKRRHTLEVVEHRELARWVVPLTGVVSSDPRGQRGERLDLDLVLPPARAQREPIASAEHADVAPQLLEPDPPLARVEPPPVEWPSSGGLGIPSLLGTLAVVVLGPLPAHRALAIRFRRRLTNHIRSRTLTGAIRPYTSSAWPSGSCRSVSAATSGRRRHPLERVVPPAPIVRVTSRASSSPTSPAK